MRHKTYDVNPCYIRDIEWKIVPDVRKVRVLEFSYERGSLSSSSLNMPTLQ
jgi:hypothetical protein